jgi:1,4-dihydroxy-2-naphthoate octaprenyltransferase
MSSRRAAVAAEPSVAALGRGAGRGRARRLWLATRPAFLPASILPVLLGTAWGYRVAGRFDVISACLALMATVFVHAASNVLNDVGDDLGGSDNANEERIFPYTGGSRFIQNGVMSADEMKVWGMTLLSVATVLGAVLTWLQGPAILLFGAAGTALGVLYSMPRWQLSAHGLGETAVAVAFGLLPVTGAAWLQSGIFDAASVVMSIPVALWVAAILLINEVPDIRADAGAGKHTLVVRLGIATTRHVYLSLQLAAIVAFLTIGALGFVPWWMSSLALLLLPRVLKAARSICDVREDRRRLTSAIEATLAVHMWGSLLLVVCVAAAVMVRPS